MDPVCEGATATHIGTEGDDVLIGTPGDDVIVGLGGADVIKGRAGNDIICAGDGDDVVAGGKGNDRILGGAGADVIRGKSGDDSLQGQDGNDWLIGNAGDDRLNGGGDVDACDGSSGNDVGDPSCDLRLNVETVEETCDLVPYADLRSCDLNGANLDRLDLTGVNFSGGKALNVSMVETVFDDADLSGATLSARFNAASRSSFVGTDLSGAHIGSLGGSRLNFTDANLSGLTGDAQPNSANQGIQLTDSIFVGTDFSGARLLGPSMASLLNSDFTSAILRDVALDFISGDFTNATVDGLDLATLEPTDVDGVVLSRVECSWYGRYQTSGLIGGDIDGASFVNADFENCNVVVDATDVGFAGARFSSSFVEHEVTGTWSNVDLRAVTADKVTWKIQISDSNLSDWDAIASIWTDFAITTSDLTGWSGEHAGFSRGSISDSDLAGWEPGTGVGFFQVELDTVDLTGTEVIGATEVTWINVTCPDGTNSDDNGNTCDGHLVP